MIKKYKKKMSILDVYIISIYETIRTKRKNNVEFSKKKNNKKTKKTQ